jgi:asparagine synthase (glutamine-hydrolysing)
VLLFASEIKALLQFPGVVPRINHAALWDYFQYRYVPAPATLFAAVHKLMPGSWMLCDADGTSESRYYLPPDGAALQTATDCADPVGRFLELLEESVRIRMMSDVPFGAFLSGGIDSTLVASTIRELLPNTSLTTFCASFDDEELNEAPYARQIAEHIGSVHHEVRFSSSELLDVFDALIDHYDEPFADASMFPTFAVCRAARQHCKVMLSGDGGDECFGGYRGFFSHSRWHPVRRLLGVHFAADFLVRGWNARWRGIGLLNFLRKDDWQLLYPEAERASTLACFQPECQERALGGLQELKDAAVRHARLSYPLSAMEDMASGYLPEQILVKVDRASMFSAVECRTPFLDRGLFEFASRLPLDYHVANGQGKALLRRCLPDWVSPEIRWRRKQGFTPPLDTWFRTSLRPQMEEAIENISRQLRHVIVPDNVKEIYRQHQAGADHSPMLFRWLVLSRSLTQAGGARG